MPAVTDYVLIGAVAAIVTWSATIAVKRLAPRVGAISTPSDDRHVHTEPVPTLGGIAMFVGFLAGMTAAWLSGGFEAVFSTPSEIVGVVLASAAIVGVGTLDDLRPVSAPAKTAGIVLAGTLLSLGGVSLLVLRIPFLDLWLLSPDWSALLTVVWVLVISNAINLIDGLDGLAAGIVGIASFTFFLYTLRLLDAGVLLDGNPAALITILTLGLCLGFLPHNVHPASIFMGDSGALLLGILMSASTVSVGGRTSEPFSGQAFFFFAPITIPIFILGVPLLDTAFAILRRAVRRQGLATPDREHLHHRLLRLGHGHWRTVFIMWAWTALLSGFVLYPTITGEGDALVPLGIGALALVLMSIFQPGLRRRRVE